LQPDCRLQRTDNLQSRDEIAPAGAGQGGVDAALRIVDAMRFGPGIDAYALQPGSQAAGTSHRSVSCMAGQACRQRSTLARSSVVPPPMASSTGAP